MMKKEVVMNKLFKIIFNQFYVWALKYNFAKEPQFSAMYFFSLLLSLNCLGLYLLIKLTYGYYETKFPTLTLVISCILIMFIINKTYVKNKEYLKEYKSFQFKSYTKRKNSIYITIAYVFISIILSFGVAILLGLSKKGVL